MNDLPADDVLTMLMPEFMALYEKRPIERNLGGLECESSLVVWWVLKSIPELTHVIECGVFLGQTSWLIENTRPDVATCHSDPALPVLFNHLCHRTRGRYTVLDFLDFSYFPKASGTTLAFFDDHQDVLPRLEMCIERGIRHVLLDDNWKGLGDHMTWWLYQNTPLIPDIAKRMECVSKQIAEQIEFRHVQNLGGLLAAQAQHQNMTYLRLKE